MLGNDLTSLHRYLNLRGISDGVGPVVWPSPYGPAERDEAYQSFSFSGWGGSSGHDAPMIALDALLASGSDWGELISRSAFHGGKRFKQEKLRPNRFTSLLLHRANSTLAGFLVTNLSNLSHSCQ